MDTITDTCVTVALPGIFAKVKLPQLPNFLLPATGGQPIPLGELSRDDVAMLGMAWQRALASHWHDKFTAKHGLTGEESEQVGVHLLHPGVIDALAKREAEREGVAWFRLHHDARSDRMDRMRATLSDFIQELSRYG